MILIKNGLIWYSYHISHYHLVFLSLFIVNNVSFSFFKFIYC